VAGGAVAEGVLLERDSSPFGLLDGVHGGDVRIPGGAVVRTAAIITMVTIRIFRSSEPSRDAGKTQELVDRAEDGATSASTIRRGR